MKLINILILPLVCFICLKQSKPNFCIAENRYKSKTVKQIIHDSPLMKLRNSEKEVFVFVFKTMVDRNLNAYILNSGEAILDSTGPQLTEKEYFALFNRKLDKSIIGTFQFDLEHSLADSICAFYGIERKDLIKIKQSKHLMGKKKKEISELFNECLEVMHEKFNREKIVESVLKELIPTVQTYPQEEQLAPTLP